MGKRVPRSCIFYSKKKLLNPRVFPISRQFLSKRVPRSYVYPKKKTDNNFEDHISQLPNEILIHILSLLTLKEAGRSSVLAHRWRGLWKFTPVLNFEAPESVRFYGIKHTEQERSKLTHTEQERSKFVTWVNQVLKLHHCPSLDEFRVCFDLCDLSSEASHDIDEWINFVIPKGVKRLELDLVTYFKGSRYTLSHKSYSCFKSPSNSSSIKFLTSLTLKDVNVNGELLEFLLSNCPLLETLCVFRSEHIVNLRVAGSSLQLKHLEIFRCKRLESLEVSAPNLVTFKYFGQRIRLHIGNLPLLSKLHIGGGYGDQVTYALVAFSSHLSQIATLELEMFFKDNREIQVPQLSNLEHLKLKIFDVESLSLLGLTSLLEAAPSLRKFTLELHSCRLLLERKPKVLKPHPHQCLKDVEMFGFVGGTTDLEIVMYLLQSTINLEKIVIDPYDSFVRSRKESKEKEAARKRAHQLEEVPCHDTGVVSVNGANTEPHDFTNNAGAPPPEYCWNGGCVGLVFIRRL